MSNKHREINFAYRSGCGDGVKTECPAVGALFPVRLKDFERPSKYDIAVGDYRIIQEQN